MISHLHQDSAILDKNHNGNAPRPCHRCKDGNAPKPRQRGKNRNTSRLGQRCRKIRHRSLCCLLYHDLQVVDLFLEGTGERIAEFRGSDYDLSEVLVFVTTKDLSAVQQSTSMSTFNSPFLGQTIEEVAEWFDENITQSRHPAFYTECFVALTSESVEEGICTVVSTQDGPLESFRCELSLAIEFANLCTVKLLSESCAGHYMRSGVVMTEANLKLVMDGGLYIEDGEVKLDQAWRDFSDW